MTTFCFNKIINSFAYRVLYIAVCCLFGFFTIVEAKEAKIVDRIVAVVNNDIITLFDLNQATGPYLGKIKEDEYPAEKEKQILFKLRGDILNQLVDEKLTDQEIIRSSISISKNEVDNAIEHIKELNYYTDEDLRKQLLMEGSSLEKYRENLKKQMLRAKLIDFEIKSRIVITEKDISSYYESHQELYGGEEKYHLKNIIMKAPIFADKKEKLAVLKRMEMVMEKIEKGESFEETAKTYSESSLAAEGGDLGLFNINDLSPQLQDAIRGLKAGDFTPVLDTEQGYQIFFIQDIVTTEGKSLEEASADIRDKLYRDIVDEKFRTWIKDLRKRSLTKIIR